MTRPPRPKWWERWNLGRLALLLGAAVCTAGAVVLALPAWLAWWLLERAESLWRRFHYGTTTPPWALLLWKLCPASRRLAMHRWFHVDLRGDDPEAYDRRFDPARVAARRRARAQQAGGPS